jgi:hypothetical protein
VDQDVRHFRNGTALVNGRMGYLGKQDTYRMNARSKNGVDWDRHY